MKQYQIKCRVLLAIDTLRLNDNYLLKNNCSERSICHRLAICLESTFGKDYNVDCEYNRNRFNVKTVDFSQLKNHAKGEFDEENGIFYDDQSNKIRSVYPDIIIHKRGTNNNNLLAIEVKKSNNIVNSQFDYEKLKLYTTSNDLKYKYGLYLEFYINMERFKKPKILLFKDGKQINWNNINPEYNQRWND